MWELWTILFLCNLSTLASRFQQFRIVHKCFGQEGHRPPTPPTPKSVGTPMFLNTAEEFIVPFNNISLKLLLVTTPRFKTSSFKTGLCELPWLLIKSKRLSWEPSSYAYAAEKHTSDHTFIKCQVVKTFLNNVAERRGAISLKQTIYLRQLKLPNVTYALVVYEASGPELTAVQDFLDRRYKRRYWHLS